MAMTEEQLAALNEQLATMNERMAAVVGAFESMTKSVKDTDKKIKINADAVDASNNAHNRAKKAIEESEEVEKRHTQAKIQGMRALQDSAKALDGFIGSLLSTQAGLKKYSQSVDSAGDALGGFAKFLGAGGPLLMAIQGVIKIFTTLTGSVFEMADASITARNELYRIGGAGAFTAEEFRKLAAESSVFYQNFNALVKPLKNLSTSVIALGVSAGEGQKAFIRLTSGLDESGVLKQFSRLGVTQEQLYEGMSEYVKIQYMSGMRMSSRFITEDQLRKASTEYVQNLYELSALTGKDIETAQKEQQEIVSAENFQIRLFKLQAEGQGEYAQRARDFVATMSQVAPDLAVGLRDLITSAGAVATDEAQRVMVQMGPTYASTIMSMLEKGDSAIEYATQTYRNTMKESLEGSLGDIATLAPDVLKLFFPRISKDMSQLIATSDEEFAEQLRQVIEQVSKVTQEGASAIGDAFANEEETRRKIQEANDKLVSTIEGPVLKAFNILTDTVNFLDKQIRKLPFFKSTEGEIQEQTDTLQQLARQEAQLGNQPAVSARAQIKAARTNTLLARADSALELIAEGKEVDKEILHSSIDAMRGAIETASSPRVKEQLTGKLRTLQRAAELQRASEPQDSTAQSTIATPTTPRQDVVTAQGAVNDAALKARIKSEEGYSNKPYIDNDFWSVGYGHNLGIAVLPGETNDNPPTDRGVKPEYSDQEINAFFEEDYEKHKSAAQTIPNFRKFDALGQAALIEATYNLGPYWLNNEFTKAKAALERNDKSGFIDELRDSAWASYQAPDRAGRIIEDIRQSNYIQARNGGIAQGPTSGYMATLHGNELIQPIDANSILSKLATTPESQSTAMVTANQTNNAARLTDLYTVNEKLLDTLNIKLDEMITKLSDANDIQTQIMRYAMT